MGKAGRPLKRRYGTVGHPTNRHYSQDPIRFVEVFDRLETAIRRLESIHDLTPILQQMSELQQQMNNLRKEVLRTNKLVVETLLRDTPPEVIAQYFKFNKTS